MRKWSLLVSVLVLCGLMLGCPSTTPAGLTSAEYTWLENHGPIKVGAFNDYPPFGFVDGDGAAIGISADVWHVISCRLDWPVEFYPASFAQQLSGLQDGTYDSLEGIFPLASREEWADFSTVYWEIATRIYVRTEYADRMTLASLQGLNVGVVEGDSGQALAQNAGLQTVAYASYKDVVQAAGQGAVDAMILDELVAHYYINELGYQDTLQASGEPVELGEMTMPVKQGNTVLLSIINKVLADVQPWEWELIHDKWLG